MRVAAYLDVQPVTDSDEARAVRTLARTYGGEEVSPLNGVAGRYQFASEHEATLAADKIALLFAVTHRTPPRVTVRVV